MQQHLQTGHRVVVQFGKQKLYTGIVVKMHNEAPQAGIIKSIRHVADEEPIVTSRQLQFWQWIADYYLSRLGEAVQAALPAALKLDSTAQLLVRPDWDEEDTELTDEEFIVVETLRHEGSMDMQSLLKHTRLEKLHRLVNKLIAKDVLGTQQELQERFKPKTAAYVRLKQPFTDGELTTLLNELNRAPKQQQLLLKYLDLSEAGPVQKVALQKASNTSASVLNGLADKEILEVYEEEIGRLHEGPDPKTEHHPLSPLQQQKLEELQQIFKEQQVALLHGVTGSGKTHIYFELIGEALEQGKQVLYLLPEIALTSQIITRIRKVFGNQVGIYHSRFNDQERVEIWQKVLHGEYQVMLGARSAMFLPFQELGLVVVDEEHDHSYKQFDPAPRYHARDAAIVLSNLHQCPTLLGTATPSLETQFNVKTGKYGYVHLAERHRGVKLPVIEVIDIKRQIKTRQIQSHFSKPLLEKMEAALERKEQVILFQNKRGFAPYLICTSCSWIPKCKFCDVSLTYHKYSGNLHCHYCGYRTPVMEECQSCHQQTLQISGFGTEKIEEELAILLPKAKIARLDLDSVKGKEGHSKILQKFQRQEIDILVGTQMVTKGLDFKHVSLVGILSADQLLSYPDFRANERAYQLMEQVSGRAGRHEKPGWVVIQAMNPENEVVQAVVHNQAGQFYHQELQYRRENHYPPYRRLIQLTLKHRDRDMAYRGAKELAIRLRQRLQEAQVLGPTAPVISRIKSMYLQDILIKVRKDTGALKPDKAFILDAIESLQKHAELRQVQVHINVDP